MFWQYLTVQLQYKSVINLWPIWESPESYEIKATVDEDAITEATKENNFEFAIENWIKKTCQVKHFSKSEIILNQKSAVSPYLLSPILHFDTLNNTKKDPHSKSRPCHYPYSKSAKQYDEREEREEKYSNQIYRLETGISALNQKSFELWCFLIQLQNLPN